VKTLGLLGVVVVGSAEEYDGRCVVKHTVELWNVEAFSCSEVNKDTLVNMEQFETFLKAA